MTNLVREYAADLDRDDLEEFKMSRGSYLGYIEFMSYIIKKYGLDITRNFKVDSNGEIYYVVY